MTLHHGDCLEVMAGMEPESVDAVVTDPPYGLGFMGKAWDKPGAFVERKARPAAEGFDGVGGNHHPTSQADVARTRLSEGVKSQGWHQRWAEAAYRLAKPSSYLLAFGGTRTVHRLTSAIEDAGWIIRDMLVWAYASGFPKGRANLKPAWEPIVMARKAGPLRMLAIDECRIGTDEETARARYPVADDAPAGMGKGLAMGGNGSPLGRWPANVILTDPIFDGGWDGVVGGGETTSGALDRSRITAPNLTYGAAPAVLTGTYEPDSGTYSRFFVLPKASRSDREPVLTPDWFEWTGRVSTHPTVKPVDLMRHLIRLVTPTGGTVLDPFLGSGTTAIAAEMEGFAWIGIEKELEYVRICEARLNGTQRGLGLPA